MAWSVLKKKSIPPFHIAVPVWGDEYVGLFLNYILPTHLSPNNLPALTNLERYKDFCYRIYTTESDAKKIESTLIFKKLSALINTSIHYINPQETGVPGTSTWGGQYITKSECYKDSIAKAAEADAANIMLNSDILLSDGFFLKLYQILKSNKRVVEVIGPRTIRTDVCTILRSKYLSDEGYIAIPPRDLANISLKYLHPLMMRHFFDKQNANFHPSHLYWSVGEKGILARCFHLYPIMVYPRNKKASFSTTIDDDYALNACPKMRDTYVANNSDELYCCELSNLDHYVGGINEQNIPSIANNYANTRGFRNIRLLGKVISIHGDAIPKKEWRAIKRKSNAAINKIRYTYAKILIKRFLKRTSLFKRLCRN